MNSYNLSNLVTQRVFPYEMIFNDTTMTRQWFSYLYQRAARWQLQQWKGSKTWNHNGVNREPNHPGPMAVQYQYQCAGVKSQCCIAIADKTGYYTQSCPCSVSQTFLCGWVVWVLYSTEPWLSRGQTPASCSGALLEFISRLRQERERESMPIIPASIWGLYLT